MGACNGYNEDSWWLEQLPYIDRGVNHLSIASNLVPLPACGQTDKLYDRQQFGRGDSIYFYVFRRHVTTGDSMAWSVYLPDGTLGISFAEVHQEGFFSEAYNYFPTYLTAQAPYGKYIFKIDYSGQSYTDTFLVVPNSGITQNDAQEKHYSLAPNPFHNSLVVYRDVATDQKVRLAIIDWTGKSLTSLETTEKQTTLDGTMLPAGWYVLKIADGAYFEYHKIQKF
jgi:hypothetical protein